MPYCPQTYSIELEKFKFKIKTFASSSDGTKGIVVILWGDKKKQNGVLCAWFVSSMADLSKLKFISR